MSRGSQIEWCDDTWNPVIGCTKVSQGCTNCFAIRNAYRLEHAFERPEYQGLTRRLPDGSLNWTGAVRCLPERLDLPLRWRKPRRVFVNSMSDLFHEDVPVAFLERVWRVMLSASHHTYQVLTKRPERMAELVPALYHRIFGSSSWAPASWIWLGVSVENQDAADERIPWLLRTPAAVRWLSCEPLLGPLELTPWISMSCHGCGGRGECPEPAAGGVRIWPCTLCDKRGRLPRLGWVVAGGESGPGGRWLVERCDGQTLDRVCQRCAGTGWRPKPEALEWVRSLRDQCQAAGVPFFWKQFGGPTPKAGGRILDGREWNQYPDGKGGIVERVVGVTG